MQDEIPTCADSSWGESAMLFSHLLLAGRATAILSSGTRSDLPTVGPAKGMWAGLHLCVFLPHQRNAAAASALVFGICHSGHPSHSGVYRATVGLHSAASVAAGGWSASHCRMGSWRAGSLPGRRPTQVQSLYYCMFLW